MKKVIIGLLVLAVTVQRANADWVRKAGEDCVWNKDNDRFEDGNGDPTNEDSCTVTLQCDNGETNLIRMENHWLLPAITANSHRYTEKFDEVDTYANTHLVIECSTLEEIGGIFDARVGVDIQNDCTSADSRTCETVAGQLYRSGLNCGSNGNSGDGCLHHREVSNNLAFANYKFSGVDLNQCTSLKKIGVLAFAGNQLETIYLPDSSSRINLYDKAFYGQSKNDYVDGAAHGTNCIDFDNADMFLLSKYSQNYADGACTFDDPPYGLENKITSVIINGLVQVNPSLCHTTGDENCGPLATNQINSVPDTIFDRDMSYVLREYKLNSGTSLQVAIANFEMKSVGKGWRFNMKYGADGKVDKAGSIRAIRPYGTGIMICDTPGTDSYHFQSAFPRIVVTQEQLEEIQDLIDEDQQASFRANCLPKTE